MKFCLTILAFLCAIVAGAKPIDDAKSLYDNGNYEQAITKLKAIVKTAPRDMVANYYLGMSHLRLGHLAEAKAALLKSEDRGSVSSAKELANLCFKQYDLEEAADHLDTWERLLKKAKKSVPDELGDMRGRIVEARNMMERVEQIEIIDSIVVSKDDFFKYYRLSADAGQLLPGSVLPPNCAPMSPAVVFEPQSNKEVFWAESASADEPLEIKHAAILDDGTFENPSLLSEDLTDGGGDCDYFYLLTDGMTFYFANNGDEGLGGYDIYMSRRDADGTVLKAQNVGMPYNSPYDDYMLVIDDAAKLGWWATDRNQIPDMVTIYTFIPNETRRNYSATQEGLARYARVTSIADTQQPGRNYAAMLSANPALQQQSGEEAPQFELHMPGGKVYTSLSDFRNRQARAAMEQYLSRTKDLALMQSKLDALRRRYASGDKSVASEILTLEKRVENAPKALTMLRNQAITNEN